MVSIGQRVVLPDHLKKDEPGLADLRLAIGDRHIEAEVMDKTGLGLCWLILPEGVIILGYSHPITEGKYAGHEFMDLHETHIK